MGRIARRSCYSTTALAAYFGGVDNMKDTKLLLSQAILWAAAILVVAMVEDRSDAVPLLAVLATIAIGFVSSRAKAN